MEGSRADRLQHGGVPFPRVLAEMLGFMLGNNRRATERDLVGIARINLEDLHLERMRSTWGSWELLVWDLMKEVESQGFVTNDGGSWILHESIVEGSRIRPTSDRNVRVTVRSEKDRARRDALASVRLRASGFRAFMEEKGVYSDRIQEGFEEFLTLLSQDDPPEEEQRTAPSVNPDEVRPSILHRRPMGEARAFIETFLQESPGQWLSTKDIQDGYSEINGSLISSGTLHYPLLHLIHAGKVERAKKEGHTDRRGRKTKIYYRWVAEKQEEQ